MPRKKRCTFLDTPTARRRSTPAWDAKACPYKTYPGKDRGTDGGPRMYQSRPVPQRQRQTGRYRVAWKWVPLARKSRLAPRKTKGCRYKDSSSARMRDTPSFTARDCPFSIKAGKKARNDRAGPVLYQSLPTRRRSRTSRTGWRTTWKWVPLQA